VTAALGLALALLPIWAYPLGAAVATARFVRRGRPIPRAPLPPASVLKPLHGAEPGLYENLVSFARQDYPRFELVLGVRDAADGALPAARALIRDLATTDIALVVEERAIGSNLKVANLANMLPRARHELILMADSDMRVGRDYLAAVAAPFEDPRTGIVTCLYTGVGTGGLWSELGALHINFDFLPSALVGAALGAGDGCFGATIALRRTVLDRIGGFERLKDELADDHRIGAAVKALGLEIVLSRAIVENRVCEPSFAALWRHELRWARTVRAMAPAGFAGSVLTHTVVIALLGAFVTGFSLTSCGLVAISCVVRWVAAAAIARSLGVAAGKLWLLPLRDALSFAVFLASFCGRSVSWRDRVFRVDPGGRMTVDGE
jgi:ceramide glucosyltransferase